MQRLKNHVIKLFNKKLFTRFESTYRGIHMEMNSYKQVPRTAGISIFHDGLPKLASVHCYDRGNVATYGLQSCQSKPSKYPITCYPIRPIPSHINKKGQLINHQRMFSEPKRPLLNQSKVYSGAFYPPGSQPRLQFVDGRPIIIPSTFENKSISKESFDPTINKSKSVIYNESEQYYDCCKLYSTQQNTEKCSDEAFKVPGRPMPTLTYHCPYKMPSKVVIPPRSNALGYTRENTIPVGNENRAQPASKSTTSPIEYPPRSQCVLPRTTDGSPPYHQDNRVVIDVDSISDDDSVIDGSKIDGNTDTKLFNENNCNNPTSRHDLLRSNEITRPLLFCNSCSQKVTLANSHSYIDDSSKEYSKIFCKDCAKKSRMWDSMKNLPSETHKTLVYESHRNYGACCIGTQCVNRKEYIAPNYPRTKQNVINRRPAVFAAEKAMNSLSMKDNQVRATPNIFSHPNFHTRPSCHCCYVNSKPNNKLRNGDAYCPSLGDVRSFSQCIGSVQLSCQPDLRYEKSSGGISRCYLKSHKDQGIDSNTPIKSPIVIDLESIPDEVLNSQKITQNGMKSSLQVNVDNWVQKTLINTDNQREITREIARKEIVDVPSGELTAKNVENRTTVIQIRQKDTNDCDLDRNLATNSKEEENCDISLELEIDEESFDSFINNDHTEHFQVEINSDIYTSLRMNPISKYSAAEITDVSRKRKLSCPDFQYLNSSDQNIAIETNLLVTTSKSTPASPNYLVNEEQLQQFRNNVAPPLKAKKLI